MGLSGTEEKLIRFLSFFFVFVFATTMMERVKREGLRDNEYVAEIISPGEGGKKSGVCFW